MMKEKQITEEKTEEIFMTQTEEVNFTPKHDSRGQILDASMKRKMYSEEQQKAVSNNFKPVSYWLRPELMFSALSGVKQCFVYR